MNPTMHFKSLFFSLVVSLPVLLSAQGMTFFQGSWEEVLQEAKKERKLVFVDAYTTWCGPCKMMARNTFTHQEVGKFFNENFINYKVDMEKGEGPGLAGKYSVRAYPTLLFVNYQGDLVHQAVGYKPPADFLFEGKTALSPAKNRLNLETEYQAGNREPEFLLAYATQQKENGDDYRIAATQYFSTQSDKELRSKKGWQAIQLLSTDATSREFSLLLKKRKKFVKIAGEKPVDAKINEVLRRNTIKAALTNQPQVYRNLYQIASDQIKDKGQTASRLRMTYAEAKKDWVGYARFAIEYFDDFNVTDPTELNDAAWTFFLWVTDEEQLAQATEWSRQAIAIKNIYQYNDTYAALLFKSGRYQDAYKVANKAVNLAYKEREDPAPTLELLEKIKEKL
ncbi:MAG: thioredoxin family protein [Bacteroidota bacterium]